MAPPQTVVTTSSYSLLLIYRPRKDERLSWPSWRTHSGRFKCRYDRAIAAFYRAFNAVFGKISRSSSEEVVLQLINSKCMPCLLYALEACPINKTQEKSLEFTINRVLMQIFRTISIDVNTVVWYTGHKGVGC